MNDECERKFDPNDGILKDEKEEMEADTFGDPGGVWMRRKRWRHRKFEIKERKMEIHLKLVFVKTIWR